jgi:Mg-chelatase subunit ChlD
MEEPSGLGGTKVEAARRAVRAFLDRLDLSGGDAASLIAFSDGATVLQTTTSNRFRLDEALDRLETRRQTRLDLGVQAGHAELLIGAVPGTRSVLIVLTDGLANPVPAEVAVERAAAAKRDGIEIYTVGLGDQLDEWALAAIASGPGRFLRAPTAAELAAVYEQIAVLVPCAGALAVQP